MKQLALDFDQPQLRQTDVANGADQNGQHQRQRASELATSLKRRGARIGIGTNPPAWQSFIAPLPEEWSTYCAENPGVVQ